MQLLVVKASSIQVPSICSSYWLLADESCGLSQAEKKTTVCRAEQIHNDDNYFHSKWQLLTLLSEYNCHFVNLQQQLISSQQTATNLNKWSGPQSCFLDPLKRPKNRWKISFSRQSPSSPNLTLNQTEKP